MGERTVHPIPPVYDKNSGVLILGSFPSVKSREGMFFYAHRQNRFWAVLGALCGESPGGTPAEKTAFLLKNRIAVWDVIASCEIRGSSDASIKGAAANDLQGILENSEVKRIFANGKTAYSLYNRLILPTLGVPAVCLPSTSPANAAYSLNRLIEEWQIIKNPG